MADIFIRDKVVMLAAYLESEGWTVWWDTNLAVGDAYRDEIMKQLAAPRAVIGCGPYSDPSRWPPTLPQKRLHNQRRCRGVV